MDLRLFADKATLLRLDGETDFEPKLAAVIDQLPALLADVTANEIVLSVYLWPTDFATEPGFVIEPEHGAILERVGCAINVVFLADNRGPIQ
jgi:hypothetical protein